MNTKKINYQVICLMIGINLMVIGNSFSQVSAYDTPLTYDSTTNALLMNLLSEDMDSTLIDFIAEQNYLSNIEIEEILPFESLRKGITCNTFKKQTGLLHPTITIQNVYTGNEQDDSAYFNMPRFYSNVIFSSTGNIAQVPVRLGGRLVTADGEVSNRLSTFQFSFDAPTFLNNYKKKWMPTSNSIITDLVDKEKEGKTFDTEGAIKMQDFESSNGLLADLTDSEKDVVKNEIKFQLYQKIISDSQFIDLISRKDSISTHTTDSLVAVANMKENLNQAKKQKAVVKEKQKAEELLGFYQSTWEKRKTYYGDSLNLVKARVDEKSNELLALQNPKKLRAKIISKKDLPLGHRFLAATRKLNMGQTVLEHSWYTAKTLPIIGLQYAFEFKKWDGELAFGRQMYNTDFIPGINSQLHTSQKGGKVIFAKFNYSFTDKTQIAYAITNIKDAGNFSNGLVQAPKSNSVFSISGSSEIASNIGLKMECALSQTAWGQADLVIGESAATKNLAAESTIEIQLIKNRLDWELGYFHVGSDFIALANPFLQNNRHGLITKLNGRIGKRLNVVGEWRYGKTIDKGLDVGGEFKNHQLMGSFNWQAMKRLNVSGQIAPNTFKQLGIGEANLTGSNVIYNLQLSNQIDMKETSLLSLIGLTNYNAKLNYFDTTWVHNTNQIFLQNTIAFNNQNSLSGLAMIGLTKDDSSEAAKTYNVFSQIDYSLVKKRLKNTIGLQLLKDAFVQSWYYGFTGIGELKLGERIQVAFEMTYQLPMDKTSTNKNRLWGRLDLTKQF